MLVIDDIRFSMAGRPLFEAASARIPDRHRVGVVGRNGTGKTTLLRLIRGELPLEAGSIRISRNARIGGVAQEAPASPASLLDTVISADTERAALLDEAESAADAARIAEIQTRLADIDAWSAEARASAILKGLGFDDEDQRTACSSFSGGWRMRVALAGALFASPDLLLLDEPTNYLDLEGALWLETYLAKYPHTVLIISHDRGLLNRAVSSILHLEDRKLTLYHGSYDAFAATRAARLAVRAAEAKKQEARRAHLQSFVDRFRYKASKAKQAQARIKMLEKMQPITAPEEAALRAIAFPEPEEISPPIVNLESASVGYDGRPVLSRMTLRIDQDDRIALLGKNGEGKSTFSKLLAGRLQPLSGRMTRANRLRVGYFAQHQLDELRSDETAMDHLRRLLPEDPPKNLRARLAAFGMSSDQADTIAGQLSGGQRARLSLLLATFDAPHLLILDEPTNHLDMESRESLVEALTAYPGAVILVSHDVHLVSLVADRLWLVKDGRVSAYDGDIDSYRRAILDEPGSKADRAEKPKNVARDVLPSLRSEVRSCEARIAKLEEMRAKLTEKLSDPSTYAAGKSGERALWQKKFAEIEEAMARAEALWIAAQERLDMAATGDTNQKTKVRQSGSGA